MSVNVFCSLWQKCSPQRPTRVDPDIHWHLTTYWLLRAHWIGSAQSRRRATRKGEGTRMGGCLYQMGALSDSRSGLSNLLAVRFCYAAVSSRGDLCLMSAGARHFSRPSRLTLGLPFNGHRGFLPRVCSERGVRLTTHLHRVQRLRISGAIPLLPLYAFMVCMGHKFLHS